MAYDDIKDPKKGSPKLSEIAVDREGEMVGSAIGESSLPVIERLARIQSDALKRLGIVLYSDGNICWDITLNTITSQDKGDPAVGNSGADIHLRFTQTSDISDFNSHEDPATEALIPVVRTIDMIITAADLNANAGGLFTLAEDDILFLRITYDDINNAASPINMIPFINRINTAVGMEALENKLDGNETTLFIPIAMRTPDWNDDIDPVDKKDLMWLVNGTTRWPSGTCAPLGSLITDLNKSLPSIFVTTENEFDTALVTLGAGTGGGIICIDRPITISGIKNVDEDIHIFGRSSSLDNDNSSLLTFAALGSFTMGDRTRLWNLGITGSTVDLINITGIDAVIEKCQIFSDSPVSLIAVAGDGARIKDCRLCSNGTSTGINWETGIDGTAQNTNFDTLATDETYTTATDIDFTGSYTETEVYRGLQALPPLGSVIGVFQWAFNGANNTGGTVAVASAIDDNWRLCDGTVVGDVNSAWNTLFVPNLTDDRFLMGTAVGGAVGGANTHIHVADGSTADFNANITTSSTSVDHTHEFNHTHAWAGVGDSGGTDFAWYTYDTSADAFGAGGVIPDNTRKPFGVVQGDTFVGTDHGIAIMDDFGNIPPNGADAMFTSGAYGATDTREDTTSNSTATAHDHIIAPAQLDAAQANHTHVINAEDSRPQWLAVQYYIRIK
jgi:hypothetical protein